ncbi:MAG: hypothetical protein ACOY3O_00060 [Thermodesulfobacteriota bacterium]
MKPPIEIGKKFREKITTRYPALDKSEIPANYTVLPIEYKKTAIEEYHIIFWHRLLRNLYDIPIEIECEIQNKSPQRSTDVQTVFLRKTHEKNNWEALCMDETTAIAIQAGKTKPFPINWKYLVKLPKTGGIVELGTRDKNTIFYIAQIKLPERDAKIDGPEAKKFINLLLEEANRLKKQLFNPSLKQEGIRLYLLFNVYLSNYRSAETMLGKAEALETELLQEFLRYDARTSDLYDEEKRKHIDQHMLTCGMYYCSAISYFYMALEGFINLVFHAFLKKRFRENEFRTEQRFDLEQKLRLMSVLCEGFDENRELPTAVLSGFKKLRNYRNGLFHSKIEDSLKGLCFVEDGFVYTYDMDEYKDRFLPAHKIKLTVSDVKEVNKLVDDIVNFILESMNQDTRNTTETYILKEPKIPIKILATGGVAVGKSGL